MIFIRLAVTIVYLWLLPFLFGMGALLMFEKKPSYAKSWFLGYLMHTALFSFVVRLTMPKGWNNCKILLGWVGLSIAGVVVAMAIVIWRAKIKKDIEVMICPKLIMLAIGVMLFVPLLHCVTVETTGNTVIADSLAIYHNGSPEIVDYNTYTGQYTGNFTNALYNEADILLDCYYACISTMSGISPMIMIRFVVSALVVMEALLGVYLVAQLLWPDNKEASKMMIISFGIMQIVIMCSDRWEMFQFLTTTWSGDVAWIYLFVPALFYVFVEMQGKLFGNKGKSVWEFVIEMALWSVCLLFCGNMWNDYVLITMEIWLSLFVAIWWLRRYVFHD